MDRPTRIAVLGAVDERLVDDLRQLPLRPEVRTWPSLAADGDAVARFEPDLLLAALGRDQAEELGALRLVRRLWPQVGMVLVTSAADEVALAPLAAPLQARLLVRSDAPGLLAAVLEQARLGGDRPVPDAFTELARGIADEINNPLQFVSGHLQLLRASFAAAAEKDRRDQVGAALAGVARIQAAVDRLRLVAQSAAGPRRRESVDLAALLRAAVAARGPGPGDAVAAVHVGPGRHVVPGDAEQLAAAVAAIVRLADELARIGVGAELQLDAAPPAVTLALVATGPELAGWQLPATFEPYYASRALRGQSAGLGLFLAQTVVLAHRGQATAHRSADGALRLHFVLPA